MRLARRLDSDDGHVTVGHSDGRELVPPFESNDDVRPYGIDLVVLEDAAGLMNQPGRIDDNERGARLAGEAGSANHER